MTVNDNHSSTNINPGIPPEVLEKYSQDIDNLLTKSRSMIQESSYIPRQKSHRIPLLVNLLVLFLVCVSMVIIFFYFRVGENSIISNYIVLNPVEGKILYKYKQETEKKLQALNDELSSMELTLNMVAGERDELLRNIDTAVEEKKQELEARMAEELEAERRKLQDQNLSRQEIEEKLSALESQRTQEILDAQEALRTQLKAEYAAQQEEYSSQLEEYEELINKIHTQKEFLEEELDKTEDEIVKLAEYVEPDEESPDIGTSNSQMEASSAEAGSSVEMLSDAGSESSTNGEAQVESSSATSEQAASVPETIVEYIEDAKRVELLSRVTAVENRFLNFFSRNPPLEAYEIELEQLELKLAVKEILTSEPVASQHPGIADELEQYYAALGRENLISGRLYALYDILSLLEDISGSENNTDIWKDIDDPDVKEAYLLIIQQLKTMLE